MYHDYYSSELYNRIIEFNNMLKDPNNTWYSMDDTYKDHIQAMLRLATDVLDQNDNCEITEIEDSGDDICIRYKRDRDVGHIAYYFESTCLNISCLGKNFRWNLLLIYLGKSQVQKIWYTITDEKNHTKKLDITFRNGKPDMLDK